MKNIHIFILIAIFGLLASCEDELYQDPITDKSASNFYNTETEIEEAVIGVYAKLQAGSLYGLYIPIIGEIPSDNTFDEVPANDGGNYGQLDEFTTITTNSLITNIWKQSYQGIQRANTLINRIAEVPFEDETVKASRLGEMQFVRAILYFNLVRLYGDVPLVTEETTNPNDYFGQERTAADQVYTQIISDLESAIQNLPTTQPETGRIRKTAAQALLGKVHLTLQNYSEAVSVLSEVKNSGQHTLLAEPAEIFELESENNAEIIFDIQFASGLNGNDEGSNMFQQTSPSGTISGAKGHNLPTVSLYNLYEENDKRFQAFMGVTSEGIPFSKKLKEPSGEPSDGGSNVIVLRYADVLLMLAEAQNELGETGAALNNLNLVRERAGISEISSNSQDEIREAIEMERRLELVSEGHRWFDLVRTGKAISVMNDWFSSQGINISIDQNDLLMPIPQSQIDTDPAITQNPGY
ncbi:RagB/SusD family nutrient uptake outer membrane protein [Chondrinema litorale]|uniref:RagB/SusD family nutrient uptake outer membrane protein n=1 Tax=Chondrinema litorale TaxID=2994555 RepID=UPI002542E302|nr:RagB/SusD family nutrient uptake outer membrane protein [Chondrinema litorale]UZR98422.1 RagB/SusD family nutrient uptake outer membrane protein [Chondrinema litorale]